MVAWAVMIGVEEGIVALDAPLRFANRARRRDAAASARPRRRLRVRRRRADRCRRPAAGSTRTRASSAPPTSWRRRPAWRSHDYLREAVWEPLGMASTTLQGLAGARRARQFERRGALRRRDAAAAPARRPRPIATLSPPSSPTWRVSCLTWADSIRAPGDSGLRYVATSRRIGPAAPTRRRRSATSAAPER